MTIAAVAALLAIVWIVVFVKVGMTPPVAENSEALEFGKRLGEQDWELLRVRIVDESGSSGPMKL